MRQIVFFFVSIEFRVTRKAISIVPLPIQIIIDNHNWNFSHVLSINHFSFSVWTSSLIFLRKLKQCVRIEAICWFYLFYDEAFVCRCRPYCNKYNVTSSTAFGLMVQLSPTRFDSIRSTSNALKSQRSQWIGQPCTFLLLSNGYKNTLKFGSSN